MIAYMENRRLTSRQMLEKMFKTLFKRGQHATWMQPGGLLYDGVRWCRMMLGDIGWCRMMLGDIGWCRMMLGDIGWCRMCWVILDGAG